MRPFPLFLSAIAAASLASCTHPDADSVSTTTPAATAPPSVATAASASTGAVAYPTLLSIITKTETAVKAKDFAKAQQEFDQFEATWKEVEDGIKKKSGPAYDAIEADMETLTTALKAKQVDQTLKAIAGFTKDIKNLPSQ